MSEVSIKTSTVADLSRMGWNAARAIERAGRAVAYNPAGNTYDPTADAAGENAYPAGARPNDNKQSFYDAVVDEIVLDQGGTASTTNVNAIFADLVTYPTPESAATAVAAL